MFSNSDAKALLFAGALLLALGVAATAWAEVLRLTRTARHLPGKTLPPEWLAHASLMKPWREQLLGIAVTLSVPIFTRFCLAGNASIPVAITVGYVAAGLCALGCLSRQRHDLHEIGNPELSKELAKPLVIFACGLALALWGLLSIALAVLAFYCNAHNA